VVSEHRRQVIEEKRKRLRRLIIDLWIWFQDIQGKEERGREAGKEGGNRQGKYLRSLDELE